MSQKREVRAILFDLDDTIATWDAVAEQSWQEVCRRFAPLFEREPDQLYATIKEVREWYLSDPERHRYMRLNLIAYRREVVAMSFASLGITAPELAIALADSYGVERERAACLLPGAIDTLKHFRNGNLRLALVTNGTSALQRKKIEKYGLAPWFDFILIEEEFGSGKPDERVFLRVLEELKVPSAEAWMVGDDLERDIGGAQKVGVFSIWVDWRGGGLPGASFIKPDRIIKSVSELVQ